MYVKATAKCTRTLKEYCCYYYYLALVRWQGVSYVSLTPNPGYLVVVGLKNSAGRHVKSHTKRFQ